MPASRRDFLRSLGGTVALAALGSSAPRLLAVDAATAKPAPKPAESLIRELFQTLSADQKKQVVYPWDHGAKEQPSRTLTPNGPILGKRIGMNYTKPQQELVQRILRAILAGDEAYERISRKNKWDNSGSFEGCGAVIFGEPKDGEKYAWVFSGHHLTVRCDGNSEPGAAFGGPIYYGHSANGHSDQNVWNYQTQRVQAVYAALDEKQRKKALAPRPGVDREGGLKPNQPHHGISYADLSRDQRALVEGVMRDLLGPFRKEDGDEVMQIIKANGGLEKIHLAFYGGEAAQGNQRWEFWRLEGPGFVWNYRVLPHVHCYVNILTRA
jgi:hypothetical protein